jgi:hypothetical protein
VICAYVHWVANQKVVGEGEVEEWVVKPLLLCMDIGMCTRNQEDVFDTKNSNNPNKMLC